jgi:membrane protein
MRGALAAAVGFEILKAVATFYLQGITGGPLGSLFGPIIGLLVFANLVSRFLLYVTAWAATAKENMLPPEVEPPPPAVIRPVVQVQGSTGPARAAGLLGVGALLGMAFRRRR